MNATVAKMSTYTTATSAQYYASSSSGTISSSGSVSQTTRSLKVGESNYRDPVIGGGSYWGGNVLLTQLSGNVGFLAPQPTTGYQTFDCSLASSASTLHGVSVIMYAPQTLTWNGSTNSTYTTLAGGSSGYLYNVNYMGG